MRFFILFAFGLFLSARANAGAWMREEGTGFASSTFTINRLRDHSSGTYVEYGWRQDITLGLDLSFASNHLGYQSGAATAFLRRPLNFGSDRNKWAYEVGAGAAWVQDIVLPHVKLGLSYGRGLEVAGKTGWLAVDSGMFWDLTSGQSITKIDGTLGINFTEVTAAMTQIYFSRVLGDEFTTFAPSLLISPKGRKYTLQLGIETSMFRRAEPSVKFGLWRDF